MTPHIEAKKEDIAKDVIMPGDPLRCKMIAEKYLTDYKLVNSVRNQLAYTGLYKGKRVTIFSSGMGNPSMGIYSYELFNFYNVENIIRVGSCGAFRKELNLYEVVLVENSYSTSNYNYELTKENDRLLPGNKFLNNAILKTAEKLNIKLNLGNVYCTDVFYNDVDKEYLSKSFNCLATEMESFALFSNAKKLGKKASTILTVSDNLITNEETSPEERQNSFNQMIELALETIINK